METSYVAILQQVYRDRLRANPSYSMRSFARDLGLFPSNLSEIFRGKKGLSLAKAPKIAAALRLPEWKVSHFCDLVAAKHAKSARVREEAKQRLEALRLNSPVRMLNREETKVFSSWIDMALLELTYLKDFQASTAWIAGRLGLKEEAVQDSVARLQKAGLLRVDEETGKWSDASALVSTTDGISSESLREFHRTVLRIALKRLDDAAPESRTVKTVVFSTSSPNLPRAREILNEALNRIVALADEKDTERDDVLCFSTQLFSLLEKK